MNSSQLIVVIKLEEYINKLFSNEGSGHDFHHIFRVKNMSLHLAESENADKYVCAIAALLHEHDDSKLLHITGGKLEADRIMTELSINQSIITQVLEIISTISFKGSQEHFAPTSIEGKCVQDADRLDAMGAIGIARTFSFGGAKGRAIYEPENKPAHYKTVEEYHSSKSSGINHFYEKLLLLKDRMNTGEAKKIAFGRHKFMIQYLNRFYKECDGIQ